MREGGEVLRSNSDTEDKETISVKATMAEMNVVPLYSECQVADVDSEARVLAQHAQSLTSIPQITEARYGDTQL